jgi:hypothetical protein
MREGDEWKTTFKTNDGLCEWISMPFVLKNAPSTLFMRLMNEILKDFIGNFVLVYLNDIIVYNKTKEEYLIFLKLVLRKLQREKRLINLKKCPFMKTKLVYLGFVISQYGLKMDPKKVKDIKAWLYPRNIYEVRSFHGLESFYRKFIRNFSRICALIVESIRKEHQPFKWKKKYERGFMLLKENTIEQPILVRPYFHKLFQVKCNANGMDIGVVISQDDKHVSYFSENLNDAKHKYSTYDQEFYVVIQDLKKWKHYLMPKEFILYTNNHDL